MLSVARSGRLFGGRVTWTCDDPACPSVERHEAREAGVDLPAGWLRTHDGRHACSLRCWTRLNAAGATPTRTWDPPRAA